MIFLQHSFLLNRKSRAKFEPKMATVNSNLNQVFMFIYKKLSFDCKNKIILKKHGSFFHVINVHYIESIAASTARKAGSL